MTPHLAAAVAASAVGAGAALYVGQVWRRHGAALHRRKKQLPEAHAAASAAIAGNGVALKSLAIAGFAPLVLPLPGADPWTLWSLRAGASLAAIGLLHYAQFAKVVILPVTPAPKWEREHWAAILLSMAMSVAATVALYAENALPLFDILGAPVLIPTMVTRWFLREWGFTQALLIPAQVLWSLVPAAVLLKWARYARAKRHENEEKRAAIEMWLEQQREKRESAVKPVAADPVQKSEHNERRTQ